MKKPKRSHRDGGVLTAADIVHRLKSEKPVSAYVFNEQQASDSRQRRYLPTLSDLVDRLTIVLQKEIFIPEHRDDYRAEMKLIMHDIDLILEERPKLGAEQIKAIVAIQLANRWIWENESQIRNGQSVEPDEIQLRRLKGTHAVNGIRATAKNALSAFDGGRRDYKVDCFAAELVDEFGNWNIFS